MTFDRTREQYFRSALVSTVGAMLVAGRSPEQPSAMHLVLPLKS